MEKVAWYVVVKSLPKTNLQDLSLNQQMKCALSVMCLAFTSLRGICEIKESCVEMKMTVVQFRTLFAGEKSLHSDWIFLGGMHEKSRMVVVVK